MSEDMWLSLKMGERIMTKILYSPIPGGNLKFCVPTRVQKGRQNLLLFSPPVVSDSLWPHRLQHVRLPCPSPSPRICPSSCSLHWWCHPAISSSDALFCCLQSFPASGTFPMSHLFALDDQNTGASASASALPVNIQGLSSLRLTCLIFLLSKGLLGVLSSTTVWRHHFFFFLHSVFFSLTLTKICQNLQNSKFKCIINYAYCAYNWHWQVFFPSLGFLYKYEG